MADNPEMLWTILSRINKMTMLTFLFQSGMFLNLLLPTRASILSKYVSCHLHHNPITIIKMNVIFGIAMLLNIQ